ncbi:hypothetical protein SAMN05421841_1984 [Chryseobacterium wanjuense]|uniref:Uncharacterized protein n=1 Tax=Chryseobacterium wanjuense TaxID=356305 RepID=A0A1I0QLG5_9FLAO|nr:hypothetical protein [Chryseobacterium wanjuense]SEW27940.1 hypothetical protein SAMN05421841_1984 [Chryseobacterium wanjuense]
MIELVNFIVHLLRRPKMFFIQEVDDFYFMISGYIAGKEKEEYGVFMDEFSKYLSRKYGFKDGTRYNLIIKSMSVYDDVTLDFLKDEMYYFLNSEEIKTMEFWQFIDVAELKKLSSDIAPLGADEC